MTSKASVSYLKRLIERFDPEQPLARAHTIPSAWYFDLELAALEREAVFATSWQLAGRAEQLMRPGSFAACEIAGEPVAVVRGEDGVLRAFANVCRHRGARVLEQDEGCVGRLRCRYHGWTYDLAGRLRGTPEFEGVEQFSREANGLAAYEVDTWQRWAFVRQHPGGPTFAEVFSPLSDLVDVESLAGLEFHGRRVYDLACNWKVFVDNYLDGGYHVNTVHPGLAGVIDYAKYRTEIFPECSVQLSPLKAGDDATVTAVRSGDEAQYWWVYPNLMINIYQDVLDTNLVLPLGPDACRVYFDFYFGPSIDAVAREQSIVVADQVQREDVGICEEVQRGLRSRSYDTGRFSVRREAAGYHFHRLLAHALKTAVCGAYAP